MSRRDDWRGRLAAWAERNRAAPFAWGRFDCARLAVEAVDAVTGGDAFAALGIEPAWRSEKAALKAMKKAGFARVSDAAAALFAEIPPAFAQIGDLAAIPAATPFGDALGVVIGERILVSTPAGLDTVDLLQASRAFRVDGPPETRR